MDDPRALQMLGAKSGSCLVLYSLSTSDYILYYILEFLKEIKNCWAFGSLTLSKYNQNNSYVADCISPQVALPGDVGLQTGEMVDSSHLHSLHSSQVCLSRGKCGAVHHTLTRT